MIISGISSVLPIGSFTEALVCRGFHNIKTEMNIHDKVTSVAATKAPIDKSDMLIAKSYRFAKFI